MLETVHKSFEGFTKKQVDKAIEARRLQATLAHPTDKELKNMIIKGSIRNCDVKVQDVTNTHATHPSQRQQSGTAQSRAHRPAAPRTRTARPTARQQQQQTIAL